MNSATWSLVLIIDRACYQLHCTTTIEFSVNCVGSAVLYSNRTVLNRALNLPIKVLTFVRQAAKTLADPDPAYVINSYSYSRPLRDPHCTIRNFFHEISSNGSLISSTPKSSNGFQFLHFFDLIISCWAIDKPRYRPARQRGVCLFNSRLRFLTRPAMVNIVSALQVSVEITCISFLAENKVCLPWVTEVF